MKNLKEKKILKRRKFAIVVVCILLVGLLIISNLPSKASATDYPFDSETPVLGETANPSNRNSEDSSYETLTETDQVSDTNISASSESITIGTGGYSGGASSFPTAIDTKDDQYRTYTEANINPASTTQFLNPTSDAQNQWDNPASPTTHWDRLDDSGTNDLGDSATTEIYTATNSDMDRYNMGDMTTPSSGYNIDVTLYCVNKKGSGSTANIGAGIRIGTTDYSGISRSPTTSYVNTSSSAWTVNPATTNEWTYTEVNALITYLTTSDASPNPYCTKLVLKIYTTYVANYQLDASVIWSGTSSTANTNSWKINVQGKSSNGENFYFQMYDYVALTYSTRITVTGTSDADYTYTLTANERSGTGEIKVKMIGSTETGDTSQTILSIDYMRIQRVDYLFECSVTFDATGIPTYGQIDFKIKGYTNDGESWLVQYWNYTTSEWNTHFTLIDLSNTMNTQNIYRTSYISSGAMKIRIDNQATPDQTKSIFYLDLLTVRHNNVEPTLSGMGTDANIALGHNNIGEPMDFWATYTDADNDAPTYMRVVINSTNYDMTKNNSGDTSYYDGCNYYFTKSDLPADDYSYYFATKDSTHSEVTGGSGTFYVNTPPTLSLSGANPDTGNYGTIFSFYVRYTDVDNDAPFRIRVYIDQEKSYHNMYKNFSDNDYTDGCAYWYYYGALSAGTHQFYFWADDNHGGETFLPEEGYFYVFVNMIPVLTSPSILPDETLYLDTEITFGIVYVDVDNQIPTIIIISIEGTPYNMIEVDSEDTDTTDGKSYVNISLGFTQGIYDYYFNCTDGYGGWTQTDTYQFTITNREPSITDYPNNPSNTFRNTYWEFDLNATDSDADTLIWEVESNASFISINSSTGLLNGTTSNIPAWFDVTVYVNDSYSGSDTYYFKIYLINRAPVITSSGNTTQQIDTFFSYCVIASDADSDILSYEFSSNGTWISIELNYLNGTPTVVAWYYISVWANDSYGGSDIEYWTINITLLSNTAPVFTSTPIIIGKNITWYIYIVTAYDLDLDELSFGFGTMNATFLSINSSTGKVTGTPTLIGNYSVSIFVFDGELTTYQNYSLNITPFSASSATDWNLAGIVGLTVSMIIVLGITAFIPRKRRE